MMRSCKNIHLYYVYFLFQIVIFNQKSIPIKIDQKRMSRNIEFPLIRNILFSRLITYAQKVYKMNGS